MPIKLTAGRNYPQFKDELITIGVSFSGLKEMKTEILHKPKTQSYLWINNILHSYSATTLLCEMKIGM